MSMAQPVGDTLGGAGFDAAYETQIKPELIKCEGMRQKAMLYFVGAVVIGLLLAGIEGLVFPSVRLIIFTVVIAAFVGYLPLISVQTRAKESGDGRPLRAAQRHLPVERLH